MKLTTQDIKELERQLDSEITFPNTWTHEMITKFNTKLMLTIYQKLQERETIEIIGPSGSVEMFDPSRPDPKNFYVNGKFDRGAFSKALREWKEEQ